ncbi:Putative methylesterase 12, chloroplastic [Dendrobium catenatum]|uniref:Methylesterase 12, chloroplastic n=1 Tax=Dendrobium catenatum TaxID=906689 RepID=A0A2I0XEU6_9ASPA|nr:Putative methylesterase 12, chloroplastic [Dendrobium catenatum]
MGNGLGCIPRTESRGGIESRCQSSSRPRRKMITEEDLLHRQALAMAIQQHQLSQRFDGSMSRRIGSTSSRKQTPSSSFRKPVGPNSVIIDYLLSAWLFILLANSIPSIIVSTLYLHHDA